MLIGLSGTHGTGKTTLLNDVKALGFKVDNSQLSRTAQASLGWESLKKAEESVDDMWALQDSILGAMYDRDQAILKRGETVLVDRTPADMWGYTSLWCKRLGIDVATNRRAISYKKQCREIASQYHDIVILRACDEIPFVAEVNRADLESREFVENVIVEFILSGGLPHVNMVANERDYRVESLAILLSEVGK